MNLELTDEQVALRDTVRRFLTSRAPIAGHVRPLLDDPSGTTDAVWRGLADLGTTALLIPIEHGGDAMTMVEAGLVCEEIGAALHPGPWLSSAVAAPRALVRFGAASEASDLYAGLADGSTIATVALPGPDDRAPVAVRRGGGVVALGQLDDVPDAAAADTLLMVVPGETDADLFAVSTSAPGLEIVEIAGIDKSRKLFRVTLQNAPAQRLASADGDVVQALIDDVVIARAADALGAARRVLEMTVEYAKVRHQFGAPIGSFQAVAHLCVDMQETVELARSGVQHALWAADSAERVERHLAALRIKAFSGRLASVGDQAIQVFGGIGFTWEHDAHLYLKRLLSFSRFLGSAGAYQERVGRELARSFR